MSGFQRWTKFFPAFDKRHSEPSKNYGIHGVDCMFAVVKDGKGITFELFTNWHLPHVQVEMDRKELLDGDMRYMFHKPYPANVAWHDGASHWEGQSYRDDCLVTGGKCYSDGSGLIAEKFYNILVSKGSDALFEELERQYEKWLGDNNERQ